MGRGGDTNAVFTPNAKRIFEFSDAKFTSASVLALTLSPHEKYAWRLVCTRHSGQFSTWALSPPCRLDLCSRWSWLVARRAGEHSRELAAVAEEDEEGVLELPRAIALLQLSERLSSEEEAAAVASSAPAWPSRWASHTSSREDTWSRSNGDLDRRPARLKKASTNACRPIPDGRRAREWAWLVGRPLMIMFIVE